MISLKTTKYTIITDRLWYYVQMAVYLTIHKQINLVSLKYYTNECFTVLN